jgi:CRISPR-associated exonuclease Cas4
MDIDDYLPISGLRHLIYCERQCALIHVEGIWIENRLTVEGTQLHERADHGGTESKRGVKILRTLQLRSDALRLVGKADIVEMTPDGPYPVEYKHGVKGKWLNNEVQLCAQAICLEEMLQTSVKRGAIYFGGSKRRLEVEFSLGLRETTRNAATRFHEIVEKHEIPKPVSLKKCENCSLREACVPEVVSTVDYFQELYK